MPIQLANFRCRSQSFHRFQLVHYHHQHSPTGPYRARQQRVQRILFLCTTWFPCCNASLMKKTTCWLRSMQIFLVLQSNNACLATGQEYTWTRSWKNLSRASTLADTHFVGKRSYSHCVTNRVTPLPRLVSNVYGQGQKTVARSRLGVMCHPSKILDERANSIYVCLCVFKLL